MATSKHATIRYNALDKCFSNFGKKYSVDDLLAAVNDALNYYEPFASGIKIRQLREDIRFMKSETGFDAPIECYKEGKFYYYRYSSSSFSINNSPLNKQEAAYLKSALALLSRFEGSPQFEWISEINLLLENKFELRDKRKIISYDTNIDYSGNDKIRPLFNSILNKKVLSVQYKPFDMPSNQFIFHPYFLKQYNNRWFVYGFNEQNKNPMWNLALDRITTIKETNIKYKNHQINFEEAFYDIIGVTIPENQDVEKVVLEFSKDIAGYIQTKALHPSQKTKVSNTGNLIIELNVKLNYELESLILSFGEKVKIIEPLKLRNKIQNRIMKSISNYK